MSTVVVAQLVEVAGCKPAGCGFESRPSPHLQGDAMRPHHQLPCVRMSLTGDVVVDFRYPPHETKIWIEVHQRRTPEQALFVDNVCVYQGDFVSKEAAVHKLAAQRYIARPLP